MLLCGILGEAVIDEPLDREEPLLAGGSSFTLTSRSCMLSVSNIGGGGGKSLSESLAMEFRS